VFVCLCENVDARMSAVIVWYREVTLARAYSKQALRLCLQTRACPAGIRLKAQGKARMQTRSGSLSHTLWNIYFR
jgi:hypothetical protein